MPQSVPEASGSGLSEEPRKEEERAAKEIHFMGDKHKVPELPESPNCSSLIALYLQGNYELTAIPPLFFQRMALLQVLDLSGTSIKSLPKSLPQLVALKKLFLRGCQLFMELAPDVGKLRNLAELDLDETQIMDLPKEIGKLLKLRHLTLSFYHVCGKKKLKSKKLIDPESISFLSQLTKLSIDVDPADKRWDDSVEAVVKEVSKSKTLRTLSLYLPKFQLLCNTSLIYPSLSRFTFTVGHHKRRTISRVPHEVEAGFRNWDKCLKFVNGENIPVEIKMVLKYSTSFFLDHHATTMNLSEFGMENMKKLKFCLLAECNKMETLIDGEMHYERDEDDQSESDPASVEHVLESLEYLSIYYMENLGSIWRSGPKHYVCMSKLKFLALHTCPQLSNIFSFTLLENFVSLEEIILEDCPQVTSLVSYAAVKPVLSDNIFLPSLKILLLLYLPELVSISNGLLIAPKLESIGCYNCPKLKSISKKEFSSKNLRIIKGECQWWEALNWKETEWGNQPDHLMRIFSPIDSEKDVMTQLAENRDPLEVTVENEGLEPDNEKLVEVPIQDHKSQWSGYTEKKTTGRDLTTSSETPWLRTCDAPEQAWGFSLEKELAEWLEDSKISEVDIDEDETKAKRWICTENEKKGVIGSSSRTAIGNRTVFRTKSDVEELDDGYEWLKCGTIKKEIVEEIPSLYRGFYKCWTWGCLVQKTVERDPLDPSFLIITYEGTHTHNPHYDTSSNLFSQVFHDHWADNVEDATGVAKTISPTKGYRDVIEASLQDKGPHPEYAGIPQASVRGESLQSEVQNLIHQFSKHVEGQQPDGTAAELRFLVHNEVEQFLKGIRNELTGRYPPPRIQSAGGRELRLNFKTRMPPLLYTGMKVVGEQEIAICVVLLDAMSGTVVQTVPESAAKLNVVVLDGDFNKAADGDWTKEEFEKSEVRERVGKRPLLTGELQVTLNEGVGTLGHITFTDNSSWIRSRKFRLGLKVAPGYCEGIRVREAKTEAFIVKDHREELYKKHYPPSLHDRVWRLEKIAKDGSFHTKLIKAGILTVKDFLRLLVRDPVRLRNILGIGLSKKIWEIIVKHAKTCVLGRDLYVYYSDQTISTGVVFNSIDELTGLIADGQYLTLESLNYNQKVFADSLVKRAYENWHQVIEYDNKILNTLVLPSPIIGEIAEQSLNQQSISLLYNKPSDLYLFPQPSDLTTSSTITQVSEIISPTPFGRRKADIGEDVPEAKKQKHAKLAKTAVIMCGTGDFRDVVQRMTGMTTDTLASTRRIT
ncbi:hypothetical protein PTKIN_Ptkin04bG0047800 [Pterospermum kingtungense]